MRVLLTTDTIGGVWTFTRELAAELLFEGNAVALISFGRLPSTSQASWCQAMGRQYGTSFQYVASDAPLEWMEANKSAYSAALPALLELAESFTPDLIHSSQFCFGRLRFGIPMVVTAHSDVLSWAAACEPGSMASSPWLTRYRELVEQGLAGADAVVAPTRWMLAALKKNFPFHAPGHVILNGRSSVVPPAAGPRKLQAVSVGRLWDKAKNLTLLAKTDSPIPILVAGEQQHEASSAPPDLGSLQPLGLLDEPALLALFACSSIYLVPSRYEPFGLAPLEAALCGCAIVAHNIPSLREVWGAAALYFNDATALSQLLARLCSPGDPLAQAQQRSLRRARELTAAHMAGKYLALYSRLMPARPAPRTVELPAHAF